jgi:hypothetical protein
LSEARSGQQQEILERFQAKVSERYGASGAPTDKLAISNVREATERAYYVVGISNETDTTYIVGMYYWTDSGGDDPQEVVAELPAGEGIAFQLTPPRQCVNLLGYIMVFVLDEQIAFISPPDYEERGPWTPERVSQEFPQDQDPCIDVWVLG